MRHAAANGVFIVWTICVLLCGKEALSSERRNNRDGGNGDSVSRQNPELADGEVVYHEVSATESSREWKRTTAFDSNGVVSVEEDDPRMVLSQYNTTHEVDLIFVLDRSGSVPREKWNDTIKFVQNILEHFTVDKNNTRVAVVTYETKVSIDFSNLEPGLETDSETKCTFKDHVDTIIIRNLPTGYTATYDALITAHNLLVNSRPSAKKVVLVVTDGKSNIGQPPLKAALNILSLRWDSWDANSFGPQVEIFAFGVDEMYMPELKSIASSASDHVFELSTFRRFDKFAQRIHGGHQHEAWIPATVARCGGCKGLQMLCVCGTHVGLYACVCEKGYEMRLTYCRACDIGYYKDSQSPDECHACPANMTTMKTGSKSFSDCVMKPGHVVCPALPDLEHASKFFVEGDATDEVPNTGVSCSGVTDGNSCHYACDVGYRLTGSPVMTCNYSGAWRGEKPVCRIIDCHRVDQFYEQWIGMTVNYFNQTTTYNSIVEVRCREGTVPSSKENMWTCDAQGQWSSSSNFRCTEVFCGQLIHSKHMEISPESHESCRTDRVSLGTFCRIHCAHGFKQNGTTDFRCTSNENGVPRWNPDISKLVCKDTLPPKIACPDSMDVQLPEFGQTSTIINYDRYKPKVTDNSGDVKYEVRGVPLRKEFQIGDTTLLYNATDEAGNSATCKQIIRIRAKAVSIENCPSDITATVTTGNRKVHINWPDPVFRDQGEAALPFTCSPHSNQEFDFGVHNIACYPKSYPTVTCNFRINITDPACPIPYENRVPTHGALVCGTSSIPYPKVCRIHCIAGYELWDHEPSHKFVCFWNGSWNVDPEEKWPACVRMHRSHQALIESQLWVRFPGRCHEVRANITESFLHTIQKVLRDEYDVCSYDSHQCRVENVQVRCGQVSKRDVSLDSDDVNLLPSQELQNDPLQSRRRFRRDFTNVGGDGQGGNTNTFNAAVRFQLSGAIQQGRTITKNDQKLLLGNLDRIYTNISDFIAGGRLKIPVGSSMIEAGGLHKISRRFKTIHCAENEIRVLEDLSSACYSCGPGSYVINGMCQKCPIGTYQSDDSATRCRACPADTTTTSPGAQVLADCVGPCSPGHFSKSGLEKCEPCALGTFQDLRGATSCKKCPAGQKTLSTGSSSEDDCVEVVDCQTQALDCVSGICFRKSGLHIAECLCPSEVDCFHDALPPVTCMNEGIYVDDLLACQCPPEFTGEFCELKRDACEQFPCRNGGSCVDHTLYFTCICKDGFTGLNCEVNLSESNQADFIPICQRVDKHGRCLFQTADDGTNFDIVSKTFTKRTDSHVRWELLKPQTSLTATVWLRGGHTSHSKKFRILSFITPNNLTLSVNLSFTADHSAKLVKEQVSPAAAFVVLLPHSVWHHVVVDWTGLTGFWRVFVNGSFVDEVYIPLTINIMRPGSMLTLAEAFDGELSQFALFDHLMTREELLSSTESRHLRQCGSLKGNLIHWANVLWMMPNDKPSSLNIRNGSWCLDVNECLYPHIHRCRSDESCVDLRGSWSCESCKGKIVGDRCLEVDDANTNNCLSFGCKNNGICLNNGTCVCPSSFTGTLCEALIQPTVSCIPNPCLNGGLCALEANSVTCRCLENWMGKYCQVSHKPSCALNPCINNGSCVVVGQGDSKHYMCLCPDLGLPLGSNCEYLAVCDTLPCQNGGTCINLEEQGSYQCACSSGYTGQNCENPLTMSLRTLLPVSLAPHPFSNLDFCRNAECHHGGSCISLPYRFICKCQRDYKGQYCDEKRSTEMKKFHVTLSLAIDYDSRLHYDTAFHENFRLQIHHLFANSSADNKMYVIIGDIRKLNEHNRKGVLVEFSIIFTFYLDSLVLGTEAVKSVLIEHLLHGRIGSIPASFEKFNFALVLPDSTETASSHAFAAYTLAVIVSILTVAIVFILLWQKRKLLFRNRKMSAPFHLILNNLQQHICKSGKLPQDVQENSNTIIQQSANESPQITDNVQDKLKMVTC